MSLNIGSYEAPRFGDLGAFTPVYSRAFQHVGTFLRDRFITSVCKRVSHGFTAVMEDPSVRAFHERRNRARTVDVSIIDADVFQLTAPFLDHEQFHTACPCVTKAFKKTMEGGAAQLFHASSRERWGSFESGKAPLHYSLAPGRIKFVGPSGLLRVFRNKGHQERENVLFTRFSHFSPSMPFFNRQETLAVVLKNDWAQVSLEIVACRLSLLDIEKRMRLLQRMIPQGTRYLVSHYQQLKEEISELEAAPSNALSLHQRYARLLDIEKYEQHRHRTLMTCKEMLPESENEDVSKEMIDLSLQAKAIDRQRRKLEERCKRFAEIRRTLPEIMEGRLCFFQDEEGAYILLASDDYPPTHPDYTEDGENIDFTLPLRPLSKRMQELLQTHTTLKGLDEQMSIEFLRTKIDELELACLDETLNEAQRSALQEKMDLYEQQLDDDLEMTKQSRPHLEGRYRFIKEFQVHPELPHVRYHRLETLAHQCQLEIHRIILLKTLCSNEDLMGFLNRREAFLKTQYELIEQERQVRDENARIACRRGEGKEWLTPVRYLVSMRHAELEKYHDEVWVELQELNRFLNHFSLDHDIHQYMIARRTAAGEELAFIYAEKGRRRGIIEDLQKNIEETLQKLETAKTEIAADEQEIFSPSAAAEPSASVTL